MRAWYCVQKRNAAELLRLYLDYDLLEEAARLTLEYIDAVCGSGKEYFDLKVSPQPPPTIGLSLITFFSAIEDVYTLVLVAR